MLILFFILLSPVAASAAFYYAYHWLKTPFLNNAVGALCIFLAVFCLGGAYAPRNGPWANDDGSSSISPLVLALQLFGVAFFTYLVGYVVRRQALKAGYADDAA